MKDLTDALRAHLRGGVTTICTCIEIVRKDKKSFRFTDHDEPLTVANAIYVPYASYARTSISTSIENEVDEMEIRGILNSNYIARDDVAGGLFDHADVRIFVVNYEDPDSGTCVLRTGWIGEVTMNEDNTYVAEIRGLSQVLTYRIGEAYSPECRADLGDSRCKLALKPPRWQRNYRYAQGTSVLGMINPASLYLNLNFVNPSFDQEGYVELTRDVEGWTTYGDPNGRWSIRQDPFYNTPGKEGHALFGTDDGKDRDPVKHTVADIGIYQDLDLVEQGVDEYDLDSGECRLYATLYSACVNGTEAGTRFRIFALNEYGGQISPAAIYDTGQRKTAEDKWFQTIVQDLLIPPGTRKLRFDLFAHKRPRYEEGAAFDTITAAINMPGGNYGSADQFGDVAFLALNDGVSGDTEPAWGNLLNTTYTDGTITWKAVKSWKRTTYVDSASNGGRNIIPTYVPEGNGYYDGGLITWETGKNAGKSQEIKSWKDGVITTFQRPFYMPKEGDRMVIHPGCDKRRVTCKEKFANILNFRGEPDVPGQDSYYSTPDAPVA
ncbi:tail assembly protein [Caulobacter phage CcrSC]|uniref:Gene transfer agent FAD/FMN-containing dehydrogenase n=1 Tax=Caulobacter phage CcrSC TaxID=2283272 RepID=A0A385EFE5_9CAUD|nr:tail assembly protein [Caulobacter phage CcrSC]AXQ69745.1 gene transfer agent FAD/FMN-containing dehydrogenase [Caulobacter phage CcrSC]